MTAFSNWNFTILHCCFTEMFIECGPKKPNFIAHGGQKFPCAHCVSIFTLKGHLLIDFLPPK